MALERQKRVSLDWSRLLGFDRVGDEARQARRARAKGTDGAGAPLRLSMLGAKISVKPGVKRAR